MDIFICDERPLSITKTTNRKKLDNEEIREKIFNKVTLEIKFSESEENHLKCLGKCYYYRAIEEDCICYAKNMEEGGRTERNWFRWVLHYFPVVLKRQSWRLEREPSANLAQNSNKQKYQHSSCYVLRKRGSLLSSTASGFSSWQL